MTDAPAPLTSASQPLLEAAALALFGQCLAASRVYLEYGCGGSTLAAAAQPAIQAIYSVDTDAAWVAQVDRALRPRRCAGALIHCDFGPVGKWGFPADTARYRGFHGYAVAPWDAVQAAGRAPDLVLVDGRFRVASFLYSLACARVGATLLFDDYHDRPQYHVVEEFCAPVARAGRMARFQAGPVAGLPRLMRLFAQYALVPD